MHEWSDGENFISSWGPWHWFRQFALASSLSLGSKPLEISFAPWHSFFRRGVSAPAWCSIALLCFPKEHTDKIWYKYPSKGPGATRRCSSVPCGDTSSFHPRKKNVIFMWQHYMWGQKPCTFSRVMGPSAPSKTREYSQRLLGKGCFSCF